MVIEDYLKFKNITINRVFKIRYQISENNMNKFYFYFIIILIQDKF